MPDPTTPRKRFGRVSRVFETSRLEEALLAAAYERVVPNVWRGPRRRRAVSWTAEELNRKQAETPIQPSLAKERYAA